MGLSWSVNPNARTMNQEIAFTFLKGKYTTQNQNLSEILKLELDVLQNEEKRLLEKLKLLENKKSTMERATISFNKSEDAYQKLIRLTQWGENDFYHSEAESSQVCEFVDSVWWNYLNTLFFISNNISYTNDSTFVNPILTDLTFLSTDPFKCIQIIKPVSEIIAHWGACDEFAKIQVINALNQNIPAHYVRLPNHRTFSIPLNYYIHSDSLVQNFKNLQQCYEYEWIIYVILEAQNWLPYMNIERNMKTAETINIRIPNSSLESSVQVFDLWSCD